LVIESQRVSREEVGDMTGDIWPLQLLAEIAREQGRNTEAQALLEQSLTPAQEYGLQREVALAHYGLCLVALARGDADQAQAYLQASLTCLRVYSNAWNDVGMLVSGTVALGAGQFLASRRHYSAYLASSEENGAVPAQRNAALALALTGLATALALESMGNSLSAARLWGVSTEAYTSRCAIPFGPSTLSVPGLDQLLVQRAQNRARASLGPTAFEAAWTAGQALTLEQAVAEALAFDADSPAPERRSTQG
jgi:tetratricopeptide (TPR) repeat protein